MSENKHVDSAIVARLLGAIKSETFRCEIPDRGKQDLIKCITIILEEKVVPNEKNIGDRTAQK